MQEGVYDLSVTAKEGYQATDTISAIVSDEVNSRVTGSQAVITPMPNPLVALYSGPPSPGGTMHVEFSLAGDLPDWKSTNPLPVVPGKSTNFLVAGMLPNATYQMRHVLDDGTASSPLLFTTGSLSASLTFPTFTVIQPPGPQSDLDQDMIFHSLSTSPNNAPDHVATDLTGRVMWYFDAQQSGLGLTGIYMSDSLVPGGSVLLLGRDAYSTGANNVLREIDLAGNPLRETNLAAVNAQLTALGQDVIWSFHHDVQRLPNGATALLGNTLRTVDINGTPTDYVGDMIVVLDQNFQVAWVWNTFDYLDVNRGPILGETVGPNPVFPPDAIDWTHSNAVAWSPIDGNLTLSVRHQDWVIKIDYENGAGDGHIIWRLGQDGDFTVNSTDPYPWFSHQHDAYYVDDTTLVVFDNGNTRYESDPNADNRGQAWTLDENTMTATPLLNADLGVYSGWFGGAQRLSNGNFSFTSGALGPGNMFGQTFELLPDGTTTYDLQVASAEYRSFRIGTLYEGINVPLGGAGGATLRTTTPFTGSGPSLVVGADLTTSGKLSVNPTTPPPSTPTDVGTVLPLHEICVDELFAVGAREERGLAISPGKRNPLSAADELWAAVIGTD
jgi:hypothetical protein